MGVRASGFLRPHFCATSSRRLSSFSRLFTGRHSCERFVERNRQIFEVRFEVSPCLRAIFVVEQYCPSREYRMFYVPSLVAAWRATERRPTDWQSCCQHLHRSRAPQQLPHSLRPNPLGPLARSPRSWTTLPASVLRFPRPRWVILCPCDDLLCSFHHPPLFCFSRWAHHLILDLLSTAAKPRLSCTKP
jgi:hypothetical protein